MENYLTIAQISDPHISPNDEFHYHIPVRQNLVNILKKLAAKPLDLLIISGDLAATTGDMPVYQWIKQALTGFPHPYVVMSGNHDNVKNMTTVFDAQKDDIHHQQLYFSRIIQNKLLLFLDSTDYTVPAKQLHWLQQQASQHSQEALLFMHHPPILCGCSFMDSKHSLRNIEETWQVISQLPTIKHIFCGHFHTERALYKAGKNIYLTPSSMLQINTYQSEFAVEHTVPSWRIIEWCPGELRTYVEYLW